MQKTVSSSLFTLFSCQLINTLLKKSKDAEKDLHTFGLKFSVPLLQIYTTKRETNLILLLQNLTFVFLDCLYKSNRNIKKVDKNTFVLYEDTPLFSRFVNNETLFCADALIAGVIEGYLRASGYENVVEAHLNEEGGTVYVIKINEDDTFE